METNTEELVEHGWACGDAGTCACVILNLLGPLRVIFNFHSKDGAYLGRLDELVALCGVSLPTLNIDRYQHGADETSNETHGHVCR